MATPTPIMALVRLGSSTVMIAIASSTMGSENSTSTTHMTARSMRPPFHPENRPTGTPMPMAMVMASRIERTASWPPKITLL